MLKVWYCLFSAPLLFGAMSQAMRNCAAMLNDVKISLKKNQQYLSRYGKLGFLVKDASSYSALGVVYHHEEYMGKLDLSNKRIKSYL